MIAVRQPVGFSANDSSGDIARYAWDLDGDGRFDDARGDNAERAYPRAGAVRVGLRVTGRNGRTSVARRTVVVQDNRSPVARFSMAAEARVGEKVVADASGSHDPDGEIGHFLWDVDGDGAYEETDERQSMTFRRPGVHAVGLRVIDDRGATAEVVHTIRVTARPPVARASAPARVSVGRELTLDASRSSSPDGAALAYQWLVDGDGVPDAAGRHAQWRFPAPGARDVRLVVVDEWGGRAETTVRVEVVNEAPSARIGMPWRPIAGDAVTFDGSASYDGDSRITAWEWDLDDDGDLDATGVRPAVRFDRGGGRRIRLRVTDEWGAHHTASSWLTVLERPKARLALAFSAPAAGSPVAFTAGSSTDDGRIERLDWDLDGDGRIDQTTWSPGTRVWFTYAAPGDRTASVTVTDDDGLQSRTTLAVHVR